MKNKSKLKIKREELGISQWDLGLMSGVNYRMIQFYEQGLKDINKAQVTTLNRLAESLGCEISDLIDRPKIKKEYLAIDYLKERKYYNEYEIKLELSEKTDTDILDYLEQQDNVNEYLKQLIRKDMK